MVAFLCQNRACRLDLNDFYAVGTGKKAGLSGRRREFAMFHLYSLGIRVQKTGKNLNIVPKM